jgi:hypothetical protein
MLRTYRELLSNVLDRAEEETGTEHSEFYQLTVDFLDTVYYELITRRPWVWARSPRPHLIRTRAPVDVTVDWPVDEYVAVITVPTALDLPGEPHDWKLLIRGQPYRALGDFRGPHAPTPGVMHLTMEAPWFDDSLVGELAIAYQDEFEMLELPDAPAAPALGSTQDATAIESMLSPGTYSYALTYIGSLGETSRGSVSSVTLSVPGTVQVLLPEHPQGSPYALGWGIYRGDNGNALVLLARVFPERRTLDAVSYTDRAPGPLLDNVAPVPAPLLNGTGVVRHILGMRTKGVPKWHEIKPCSEMELREDFGWWTPANWPPRAYARITPTRIAVAPPPSRDNLIEVYHTTIGKPLSLCSPNEILVPMQHRHVLADAALGLLLDLKGHSSAKEIEDVKLAMATASQGAGGTTRPIAVAGRDWFTHVKEQVLAMEAEDEKAKKGFDNIRRGLRHEVAR